VLAASGVLWSAALGVYLVRYGRWLVAPSLPRDPGASDALG